MSIKQLSDVNLIIIGNMFYSFTYLFSFLKIMLKFQHFMLQKKGQQKWKNKLACDVIMMSDTMCRIFCRTKIQMDVWFQKILIYF